MDLLAASLRYWTVQKMNSDPAWKGVRLHLRLFDARTSISSYTPHLQIQVIISDASVPGEGEHKIMDFIRRQRVNPGHNPNTQHVIYGLVRIVSPCFLSGLSAR